MNHDDDAIKDGLRARIEQLEAPSRAAAELRARNVQLETTGQALVDNAVPNPDGSDTYVVDTDVLDEFRAVLHGNAIPAAPRPRGRHAS